MIDRSRPRARVRMIRGIGWLWYCRACPAADSNIETSQQAHTDAGRHVWHCRRVPPTQPLEATAFAEPITRPIIAGDELEGISA